MFFDKSQHSAEVALAFGTELQVEESPKESDMKDSRERMLGLSVLPQRLCLAAR